MNFRDSSFKEWWFQSSKDNLKTESNHPVEFAGVTNQFFATAIRVKEPAIAQSRSRNPWPEPLAKPQPETERQVAHLQSYPRARSATSHRVRFVRRAPVAPFETGEYESESLER